MLSLDPVVEHTHNKAAERRSGPDRRQRPTPMLSRYALFGGRRRTVRRDEEREGAFVDVHGPRILLMTVSIVALNLLDAWFTLLFLSHGGQELNPMVQFVLDLGGHPWPFLLLKTVGIGCLCAFLVLTKNFRSARFGLWFLHDGVWQGERLLPEGFVAQSLTPAPTAARGRYGLHWWLNVGEPDDPQRRPYPTLPRDLFAANGFQGQRLVVIPSRQLVVVRLGCTKNEGLVDEPALLGGVLAALPAGR